jgi:hypothetical protein
MASTVLFNTGNNLRAVFMGAYGRLDLSHITGFHSKPIIHQIMVKPLGNSPLQQRNPAGWDFTFQVERKNAIADNYQALKEANFWAGAQIPTENVFIYITETDGSTTKFTFTDCVSSLDDAGNWQQESSVKLTINGFAGKRLVSK